MRRHSDRGGFSLLEMMVVLAIITVLAILVVPSFSSVLRGSALTQATANVVGQLTFCQQSAIAQNQTMEVRMYQYADPTFPGETTGNAASGKYRALQVFEITSAGTAVAWGKMVRLPGGIIIDSGTALSSLLQESLAKIWTASDPQIALPGIGTNYNCKAFRLRADGSTSLSTSAPNPPGTWCLTLHSVTLGDALAAPPANFATIQMDPVGGKIITFRP